LLQRLRPEGGDPSPQLSKGLPDGVSSMTLAEAYRHFPMER
jgi:hypothetical protein